MKKLLLIGLLVGLTASAFAQGQVTLRNVFNTDPSPTATTGGLFFLNTGNGPVLINQDFNAVFYGGSDSANLAVLGSFIGAGATGDNAGGAGTFFSGTVASIPGATSSAFLKIEAWTGSATTWANATGPGVFRNQVPGVFTNPLGNPNAQPPETPKDLDGMPAITLAGIIPEPSSFALAGLGAAALLIFRRRK